MFYFAKTLARVTHYLSNEGLTDKFDKRKTFSNEKEAEQWFAVNMNFERNSFLLIKKHNEIRTKSY